MRASTFANQFDKISTIVEFNQSWKNGTGYLDGACSAKLGLAPGQRAKTTDDYGRRVILIGTQVGNHVVFDRHSGNADKQRDENIVVVNNHPRALVGFVTGTCLSDDDFYKEVGLSDTMNIGADLHRYSKVAANPQIEDEDY